MANSSNLYTHAPHTALGCPRCGGVLVRVRRKPFDRLLSLLSPRRRYRCRVMGCGWEGALHIKR
jgi:hypothetical protein